METDTSRHGKREGDRTKWRQTHRGTESEKETKSGTETGNGVDRYRDGNRYIGE